MFRTCLKSNTLQANFAMEINSLKMGENKSYGDCILGFYAEIMNIVASNEEFEGAKPKKVAEMISKTLNEWEELLKKFVVGEADQFALL